jgi:hypothetical protein
LYFYSFSFHTYIESPFYDTKKGQDIELGTLYVIYLIGVILIYKHLFPGRKFEKDYDEKEL